MDNHGWLVGWKEIGGYLGISVQYAKNLAKNHYLPVFRFPSGKPFALADELNRWAVEREKLKKNQSVENNTP